MATTSDMAPGRGEGTTNARKSSTRSSRNRAREESLEQQIGKLQEDLKAIAGTITKLAERRVDEVRGRAEHEVQNLMRSGEHTVEEFQGELESIQKQMKATIRHKPLTAVVGAVAVGYILALLTRR
jgi:ElaB/YqjD/DUF883 family membrane-anchored ribosome-binding protein